MTFDFEQSAFALEVVHFAVIDDPDGFFRVAHRLVTGRRKINDTETGHPERHAWGEIDAAIVRPAMMHRRDHGFDRSSIDFTPHSADATHYNLPESQCSRCLPGPRLDAISCFVSFNPDKPTSA